MIKKIISYLFFISLISVDIADIYARGGGHGGGGHGGGHAGGMRGGHMGRMGGARMSHMGGSRMSGARRASSSRIGASRIGSRSVGTRNIGTARRSPGVTKTGTTVNRSNIGNRNLSNTNKSQMNRHGRNHDRDHGRNPRRDHDRGHHNRIYRPGYGWGYWGASGAWIPWAVGGAALAYPLYADGYYDDGAIGIDDGYPVDYGIVSGADTSDVIPTTTIINNYTDSQDELAPIGMEPDTDASLANLVQAYSDTGAAPIGAVYQDDTAQQSPVLVG